MSLVTYKGITFDYSNPTAEMINPIDITKSLSRINRFIGHSKRGYSVAEHTWYCYTMANVLKYSERERLLVLLHDFTEAYVGDCPTPLKKLLPEFAVIEEKVEMAIYDYFGIKPPTEEEYQKIKAVDATMLVIEMRDLTFHNWENFINDNVIKEMLDDDFFVIDESELSEDEMAKVLYILLQSHFVNPLKK